MRLFPRALSASVAGWRQSFPLHGHNVARWFPGHMAKGEVWREAGFCPLSQSPWYILRCGLFGRISSLQCSVSLLLL